MTYLVENKRVCLQKTGSWARGAAFSCVETMLMAGLPCFSILSRDVLAQNPRRGKRRLVQRDFRLERLREFVRTPSHRIDAEIAQDLRESGIAREGRDRARQPIDHGLRSAGRHENAVPADHGEAW